ncbi:SagB/ThcOx family dehydrogenase [candidate division WOR-3 bacterium]|uniref:SagB/ThcOx family dehydrogenase n=1 Tax=candidate division WOR-3 bacterium TaxID=2052148 RepID=A0A9D5K9R5_UNCW3|nr:SagB/ThcOx family dehydrogenase [candidate division WOR-3 bacterium]MBD3364219.1 SagB/ThcOx family dehydrogenase [candidate division WOR-3 bacterium]
MKYFIILGALIFLACPKEEAVAKQTSAEQTPINLPEPIETKVSVEECLRTRRSIRSFTDDTLSTAQIATLLWSAQGITEETRGFRTAPSAGATFPLEAYLFTHNGVYVYNPSGHILNKVKDGDLRGDLCAAANNQAWVKAAPVSVVLCAVPERTSKRYGDRTMRYIYMEAGHAAQNIHLQAVALELGSVPVGAFDDDALSRLLGLHETEPETVPLYIIPVGKPVQ